MKEGFTQTTPPKATAGNDAMTMRPGGKGPITYKNQAEPRAKGAPTASELSATTNLRGPGAKAKHPK